MKRLLISVAAILLLIIVLLVGLAVAAESAWFARFVARQASGALDREITVDGALDIDWSLRPLIRLPPMTIANPEWAGEEPMARIQAAETRVDVPELLRGRVELEHLQLEQPQLHLVREAERSSWEGLTGEDDEDQGGFPELVVNALRVRDGQVVYRDATQPLELEVDVRTVRNDGDGAENLEVKGQGSRHGQPFSFDLRGGPLLAVTDEQKPYPVEGWLQSEDTRLQGSGTLSPPLSPDRIDFDLRLNGPNPADLHTLLGITLPDLPPYDLRGHLNYNGDTWSFRGFEGTVGDSDLSGNLAVRPGEPVQIEADLESDLLDVDDLLPIFGAPPKTGAGETAAPEQEQQAQAEAADDEVLPEAEADRGRLQNVQAKVSFIGQRVKAPRAIPLEQVEFELSLDQGQLSFEPFRFGVGGGEIDGVLALNAAERPAQGRLEASMREVDLGDLLQDFNVPQGGFGTIRGRLEMDFTGESVAEALGSADGILLIFMSSGRVDAVLVSLAGLDAGQALIERFFGGGATEIECAFVHMDADDGMASVERFLIATEEIDLTAAGQVDLGAEEFEVALRGYPRDPTLGASDAPIRLTGAFADAELTILSSELLARGAAAALAGLIAPPLALVPFVHLGTGDEKEDVCAGLIREARQVAEEGMGPEQASARPEAKAPQAPLAEPAVEETPPEPGPQAPESPQPAPAQAPSAPEPVAPE